MSGGALTTLQALEQRGLVKRLGDDAWALTDAGRARAAE
jgi:Mn-dependent DtxR family transcriptional regulator